MPEFNFDRPIKREDTASVKYDVRAAKFGRPDVIPLWVADMDFATPPCVQRALKERVEHPIFGYSIAEDSFLEAFSGWYARRHKWEIDPAKVLWAPGTVTAMAAVIEAVTEPGDKIIAPTPVYPPFLSTIEHCKRRPVPSPMRRAGAEYRLDLEHIEEEAKAGAKMLLLCNPHNPVGRAWREAELRQLAQLADRYGLIILSDDVHADFVYTGASYTPLAKLVGPELRLITLLSTGKTFNLSGISMSAAVFSHRADQRKTRQIFDRNFFHSFNPLTTAAFQSAWRHGDAWLDALLTYLEQQRDWLHQQINALDGFSAHLPEATYLLWVDARETGMSDEDLWTFFVERAGLGISEGPPYGPGAAGHIRLNFATTADTLTRAISQLSEAVYGGQGVDL